MNDSVFNDILIKAQNNFFLWQKVFSCLNPPEFVDTYQYLFSKISTKELQSKNHILANQYILSRSPCNSILEYFDNMLSVKNIFAKVALWKIEKTGAIHPHVDSYPYHKTINRYILNINMNLDLCKFKVDSKNIELPIGKPVFFNHLLPHSLENNQQEDVFFLQIDTFK